ncbi:hypothetical protein BANRA_02083 [Klebsiella pneumoniae]|nr:hypothetical protein BANRA_02083 [Klebsiella pneumoniae]
MSEKTEATVKLDSPIKRGDTTITEIMLRKPQSGALRGTRLQAVMEMDVASMFLEQRGHQQGLKQVLNKVYPAGIEYRAR